MWKNRLILLACIIGSGTLASFYGGRISYTLFAFTLLVPVISLLYTFYVYIRFAFMQKVYSTMIVKGEPTDFYFQLCNQDFVTYTSIQIRYFKDKSELIGFDEKKEFCLQPGEKEEIHSKLTCKYRGEYVAGIYAIVIRDYLSILQIQYPVHSKLMVTVLPRKVDLSGQEGLSEDEDEKKIRRIIWGEETPDAEVHPYIAGESIKRIHWKSSAKRQEIMTRKYRTIDKKMIVIYLDLSPVSGSELEKVRLEDAAIEETLAIIDYCFTQKMTCTLVYEQEGYQRQRISTPEEMENFYSWCAKIPFESHGNLVGGLRFAYEESPDYSQYIVILHELSQETFQVLSEIAGGDRMVSVGLFTRKLSEKELLRKKALEDLGTAFFFIKIEDEEENANEAKR